MLQALEFDRVVEVVRGFAATPLGEARLTGLQPQTDGHRVAQALAATTEAVTYLQAHGSFPLQAPDDIDAILSALAIEGRALDPPWLLGLAGFLESIDEARAAVRRLAPADGLLRALVEPAASFSAQVAEVRRQVAPTGEVVDAASQELRMIRERLRKQRTRLRGTFESFLRGKETAKYLQEHIVTERNGRFVLVVRTEHRAAIPGIIHGSSGSGASLYLEPLSTVEINNEVVALEEQEAAEVHRLLLALSNVFRGRALDLQRTIDIGAELDVLQAKARFADLVDGTGATLVSDGRIELRGARHPLLIPSVAARLEQADVPDGPPTPVDLVLLPPTRVLLITGPNTGGKTVALKTAGLLALMTQAGLHVPAAVAALPVFRSVFADIGDEQSIAESLSTFSGHIAHVVAMDRTLAAPALVLLDEIGVGTDPAEGGALGVAIVDHFRQRGAHVLSTTHYDALKAYAATTDDVASAACGFDPDTFEPTYSLTYGSPGRSLALEIAGRLGLNPEIIAAARRNLSAERAQLADQLARVDADLRALDHERRLVRRERESLEHADERARAREAALRQREESSASRLNQALDERLRQARTEIDAVLDELRRRAAALADQAVRRPVESLPTGVTGAARADARTAVETVVERFRPQTAARGVEAASRDERPAAVGDRVAVGALGLEGIVALVHDREAEIDVRGKRLRSPLADLRVIGNAAPAAPSPVRVSMQLQPHERRTDLNLIGSTVDDALARVEKFLDESLLDEQRVVRLIHGHGTGQLRRAVARFLEGHPLVADFRTAPAEEGGGGVTVVELKE